MTLDKVLLIAPSCEFLFKKCVRLLRPKVRLVILLLPEFELPLLCLCDVDLLLNKLEVAPMVMELELLFCGCKVVLVVLADVEVVFFHLSGFLNQIYFMLESQMSLVVGALEVCHVLLTLGSGMIVNLVWTLTLEECWIGLTVKGL